MNGITTFKLECKQYNNIRLKKEMNIDFILFSAPKVKYNPIELMGETIFIPSFTSTAQKNPHKNNHILASLTNCYRANKTTEVYFSIESALSEQMGEAVKIQSQGTTDSTKNENDREDQQLSHYIPCLFLNSMVGSQYLVLYFHSSGEDIKSSYGLLNYIRNSYQVNVIAMQYPGYSIYKGSVSSEQVVQDSKVVYSFITKQLGFQQRNIIIIGRSIGTGVALQLLKKRKEIKTPNPRCLVLISPFASVKNLVRQFLGKLGTLIAKQTFDNLENIMQVKCPVFIVHGKKDSLISTDHSKELIKNCYVKKQLLTPESMTHSTFDYYSDLVDPLRQFLMSEGVNFYEQNMKGPAIPEELFKWPQKFIF